MIPGIYDEKKPNELQTYDHGTLYRNTITSIICDKFGAERSHRKNGTVLTFDPEKLVRIGNLYNLETKIQTKIAVGEGSDAGEGSRGNTPVLSQYKNDGESSDAGEDCTLACSSTGVSPTHHGHDHSDASGIPQDALVALGGRRALG